MHFARVLIFSMLCSVLNIAQVSSQPETGDDAKNKVGQSVAQSGPVFGDWKLLCGVGKKTADRNDRCRVSQSVISEKTKARLFLVRVFKGTPAVAMVSTPHSIFLKPGLVVKIDDHSSRAFSFETCNEDGCHIGIPLNPLLSAELRSGKRAVFHFFDGAQHRVSIPVSLNGFSNALNALNKTAE